MQSAATSQAKDQIARLNDLARTAMGVASQVVMTEGVRALGPSACSRIRQRVETFNDFEAGNDPHGERDFGAFLVEIHGVALKVFWKIDYYDCDLKYGSDHPEDPTLTRRVLTIMLAEEY